MLWLVNKFDTLPFSPLIKLCIIWPKFSFNAPISISFCSSIFSTSWSKNVMSTDTDWLGLGGSICPISWKLSISLLLLLDSVCSLFMSISLLLLLDRIPRGNASEWLVTYRYRSIRSLALFVSADSHLRWRRHSYGVCVGWFELPACFVYRSTATLNMISLVSVPIHVWKSVLWGASVTER